ncbi:MAG TPA: hypothetical protein VI072_03495 [Polyangiaceae bacterium]
METMQHAFRNERANYLVGCGPTKTDGQLVQRDDGATLALERGN